MRQLATHGNGGCANAAPNHIQRVATVSDAAPHTHSMIHITQRPDRALTPINTIDTQRRRHPSQSSPHPIRPWSTHTSTTVLFTTQLPFALSHLIRRTAAHPPHTFRTHPPARRAAPTIAIGSEEPPLLTGSPPAAMRAASSAACVSRRSCRAILRSCFFVSCFGGGGGGGAGGAGGAGGGFAGGGFGGAFAPPPALDVDMQTCHARRAARRPAAGRRAESIMSSGAVAGRPSTSRAVVWR